MVNSVNHTVCGIILWSYCLQMWTECGGELNIIIIQKNAVWIEDVVKLDVLSDDSTFRYPFNFLFTYELVS